MNEFISAALPIVYVVVGLALIWLVVELVLTVRKARKTVDDLEQQLQPTLQSVEKIAASAEPAVSKADPLMERVTLTVDAANLEIMRLDQILEDVNEITDTLTSAVDAVDTVTNAPIELANTLSEKVRGALKPKRASDESVALGQQKAAADAPAAPAAPARKAVGGPKHAAPKKTEPEPEPEPAAEEEPDSGYFTYGEAAADSVPAEQTPQQD